MQRIYTDWQQHVEEPEHRKKADDVKMNLTPVAQQFRLFFGLE
jgi:hypothetical protein